jgi:hypothetical protein
MSLLERAWTGVREMPSNAAWVIDQVRESTDAVETAAERAKGHVRRLSEAVVDPAADGETFEARMRRAQDAAEQAREAEERAVEAAQDAKERSEHALHVSERGRARVQEVDRETARQREQRIKEAEREAELALQREREAASAEAEQQRRAVYADVESQITSAERAAEEAQQRAVELVEEAATRIAEARRLADEAAEKARLAAEEARRHAEQLGNAQRQTAEAGKQINLAEELRERTAATANQSRPTGTSRSELRTYRKPELVQLAAAAGIEGRSSMSKDQLVAAIGKASRSAR